MPARDPLTIGPVEIASIEGDFYAAVSKRLARMRRSWTDLAVELGDSRQNLERALRKQRAIRLENVRRVITGLRGLRGLRPLTGPAGLRSELTDLGLTVRPMASEDDVRALRDALALTKPTRARKR